MYPNSNIRLDTGTSQQLSADNNVASSSSQKTESFDMRWKGRKTHPGQGLARRF